MDSNKRKNIINNVIRANNAIIDLKIKLKNIKTIYIPRIFNSNFKNFYGTENSENTIKSILLDDLKKQEEEIIKNIRKLELYIKKRLNVLIGIKLDANLKYIPRYFAETFEKEGEIKLQKGTIFKGSPITHFSVKDLNVGYVILNEIIFDYEKGCIKKSIPCKFIIRTGELKYSS